MVPCLVTLADL